MPTPAQPILTNTTQLADRWNCCTRTVLRICRAHQLTEIRLRPNGRVYFCAANVADLEKLLFIRPS